jgi:hypothetical protein
MELLQCVAAEVFALGNEHGRVFIRVSKGLRDAGYPHRFDNHVLPGRVTDLHHHNSAVVAYQRFLAYLERVAEGYMHAAADEKIHKPIIQTLLLGLHTWIYDKPSQSHGLGAGLGRQIHAIMRQSEVLNSRGLVSCDRPRSS